MEIYFYFKTKYLNFAVANSQRSIVSPQQSALSKTLANEPSGNEEKVVEKALRPKLLEEFSGQRKIVDNLQVFIQAAKQR